MPWTFVHPAAVLPLRRFGAAHHRFGALVIGSLSPDFAYYLNRFDLADAAHTLPGLATLCLPSSLAVLVLARLLHGPVAHLLPEPHRSAIEALPRLPALNDVRRLPGLSAAILVGAATHNAWDSFTHRSGYMAARLPLLEAPTFTLHDRSVPVYDVLQHGGTVVGLVVLGIVYARWLKTADRPAAATPAGRDGWRYGLLIGLALASMALAVPFARAAATDGAGSLSLALFIGRFAVFSTTNFVVAVCAAALLLACRRARPARP